MEEKIITIDFDTSATASFDASTIGGVSDDSNWKIYLQSLNFCGNKTEISPVSINYYLECPELSTRSDFYTNLSRTTLFHFSATPSLTIDESGTSGGLYNFSSFNEIYLGKMKDLFKIWNFTLKSNVIPTIINFTVSFRLVKQR